MQQELPILREHSVSPQVFFCFFLGGGGGGFGDLFLSAHRVGFLCHCFVHFSLPFWFSLIFIHK